MHSQATLPAPLSILGINVTPFESREEAAACVDERIASRQKTFCIAINPEKIHVANRDPKVKRTLMAANMWICDGVGVTLASRILHGRWLARCTGVDLFYSLMRMGAEKRWKIFLLGASPQANEGAWRELTKRYPTLQIVGRQDGYFKDPDDLVRRINECEADAVFVAMGSPRQELWIIDNMNRVNASYFMGVGGTFDVVSGTVKRAPAFFRATGTEFLYRLLASPSRWRRQICYPVFMVQVLCERFLGRRQGGS